MHKEDLEEALRLIRDSKRSLLDSLETVQRQKKQTDYQADVLNVLKNMYSKQEKTEGWNGWISMTEAITQVEIFGYTREQLMKTIKMYVDLGVLIWRSETFNDVGFAIFFNGK